VHWQGQGFVGQRQQPGVHASLLAPDDQEQRAVLWRVRPETKERARVRRVFQRQQGVTARFQVGRQGQRVWGAFPGDGLLGAQGCLGNLRLLRGAGGDAGQPKLAQAGAVCRAKHRSDIQRRADVIKQAFQRAFVDAVILLRRAGLERFLCAFELSAAQRAIPAFVLCQIEGEPQLTAWVLTLHKPDIQIQPFQRPGTGESAVKVLDAWVRGAPKRLTYLV